MPNVKYLIVHTAAADIPNVDAAVIDRWHRKRKFKGIGYHYVIIDDRHDTLADGTIQTGRSEDRTGAHAKGVNSRSLGVCCVGHGDVRDFTQAQKGSLTGLLVRLAEKYNVPTQNILGHREINTLIPHKLAAKYETDKSCPGHRVDMDEIRGLVEAARNGAPVVMGGAVGAPSRAAVIEAIRVIERNEAALGNAIDEWRDFRNTGEVHGMMG